METRSQFALLGQRRFLPFFISQTLNAFNDNVFKNALVIFVTFGTLNLTQSQQSAYANVAGALFILPFFLFSATAGQIAEKYEKSWLIQRIKLMEVGIALLAAVGFWFQNLPVLFGVLFLYGLQATLFGPVKYSILPQALHREELVGGNALVETATSLAILLGTLLGGVLMATHAGTHWVSVAVVVLAVAGWIAARMVPRAEALEPNLKVNWNPVTETMSNLRFMRGNRTVLLAALGISWFWFYGATFLAQLPSYAKNYLGGNEEVVTLLLAVFSVGTAIGSLLCERLSGHKVEIGLVPLGSIGLTLFGVDLYFAQPEAMVAQAQTAAQFLGEAANHRILWDLGLIGLFAGFYIVPLYALIQTRTEASHRSRVIAGNNILNALFMVGSAVMAIVLLQAGLTLPELFLVTALMNAAVAVFIYSLVPEFLMRFVVWILVNTLYRIDVKGLEKIPDKGPCIVVANHVSFVDALILGGSIRRPVRFVMYHKIFKMPGLGFIFRTAKAIPIAPAKENEALMNKAFDDIAAELAAGNVVGIFPEGGLTTDGNILQFRAGVEKVLARTPVPVVPVALQGLWGSIFSRRDDFLRRARLPRRFRSKIGLVIGDVVPAAKASAPVLEAKVRALRGEWA